jgi:hypothetical protein
MIRFNTFCESLVLFIISSISFHCDSQQVLYRSSSTHFFYFVSQQVLYCSSSAHFFHCVSQQVLYRSSLTHFFHCVSQQVLYCSSSTHFFHCVSQPSPMPLIISSISYHCDSQHLPAFSLVLPIHHIALLLLIRWQAPLVSMSAVR